MIPLPSGVRVWLATGHTDMRRGMNGLALQIQEVLKRDPYGGHLFVFRGRRGDLVKVIWWDGQGACIFYPRNLCKGVGVEAGSQCERRCSSRSCGLDEATRRCRQDRTSFRSGAPFR